MRNTEPGRALFMVMAGPNRASDAGWADLPEPARQAWAEKERLVIEGSRFGDDLNACQLAIVHLLGRIKTEAPLRYHLGLGTRSFKLLTDAFARLCDESVKSVRERVIPGSGEINI